MSAYSRDGRGFLAGDRSRYGTTDRNADAVKLAQTIGADEGIVAEGKQVDQVLDLTDGTGAGVIVDF